MSVTKTFYIFVILFHPTLFPSHPHSLPSVLAGCSLQSLVSLLHRISLSLSLSLSLSPTTTTKVIVVASTSIYLSVLPSASQPEATRVDNRFGRCVLTYTLDAGWRSVDESPLLDYNAPTKVYMFCLHILHIYLSTITLDAHTHNHFLDMVPRKAQMEGSVQHETK